MQYPKVATRTCADCKAWRYTADGDKEIGRNGLPVVRPPGDPTPCEGMPEACPRRSPENEAATTLSEKNWKAYVRYLEVRSTFGATLSDQEKQDPLSRKILRTIDMIVRDYELGLLVQSAAVGRAAGGMVGDG